MARRNQNSFEKRRRDMEKKLRADDKRKKRLARKKELAASDRLPTSPELTPASDDGEQEAG